MVTASSSLDLLDGFIDHLWLVNTHDTLLTFTSSGKVFWLPVQAANPLSNKTKGK